MEGKFKKFLNLKRACFVIMCTLLPPISRMTFKEVARVCFPAKTLKSKVGKIYTNHGGFCNWDQLSKRKSSVCRSLYMAGLEGLVWMAQRLTTDLITTSAPIISRGFQHEGKGSSLSWVEQQQYFRTTNKKPGWGVIQITQSLVFCESVLQFVSADGSAGTHPTSDGQGWPWIWRSTSTWDYSK